MILHLYLQFMTYRRHTHSIYRYTYAPQVLCTLLVRLFLIFYVTASKQRKFIVFVQIYLYPSATLSHSTFSEMLLLQLFLLRHKRSYSHRQTFKQIIPLTIPLPS
ncbi:hypothetical protein EYC80_005748 [Monilinia laxa]|uniref:Uncharacterized protein n=1 Tax=Monilinia laxa TaxID=61186 RepID=A0A5N6KEZ8_MONLA|nr:hypothetical protein EYC80_005748 [Monilinia laxa]